MTNYQQAQMTRNTGTCVYLAANTAATVDDIPFIAAASKMETDTAAADVSADAAATDNTGYSLDKEIEKDEVSQMAAQLCASSKVKMDKDGNNVVSNALKDSVTYYLRASDAVCVTRLMSVYNTMLTNILLITSDYLTEAQLATFLTKINSFRTLKGSTTLVNTNMPLLTAQLKTDLKQTCADIVVLKMLLKKYKLTNPTFYNGLRAACKMPAVTILHTTVYIIVIDASTTGVLAGVQGTLTRSKQLPVTNVGGVMVYTTVGAGMATGTFAKQGFVTKIVKMTILSGKKNTFTVALTPGIMTAEQEAAVIATVAKIVADEKAAKATKAKLKKEAKAAAALVAVTVVEPEAIVPKTTEDGAV